jgi:DNA-binding NarL/FixJ family response regulator
MSDPWNAEQGGALRVLIADDHCMVRAGLRMLLEDEPDIEVVGEAGNGDEAFKLALELSPAVLLADMRMPPPDGIELARLLYQEAPNIRTIILSVHDDVDLARDALAAGAAGYVTKRSGPLRLLQAIHHVAAGKTYIDTELEDASIQHQHNPTSRLRPSRNPSHTT